MAAFRKLRVFLCHASQDKPAVREVYKRLSSENWIDPWLDEEKLLPGQDWDLEIEKAVEAAEAVIVCLSNQSVTKEGYIQRELKFVLDIALEKPEGTIFVVPLRLDDCALPRRLRALHYVDYFPVNHRKAAYQRLLQSLHVRYTQLFSDIPKSRLDPPDAEPPEEQVRVETPHFARPAPLVASVPVNQSTGLLNTLGPVLCIVFFILTRYLLLDLMAIPASSFWACPRSWPVCTFL